ARRSCPHAWMNDRGNMIEDKIVLDKGVSSGIGRETAQLLAERGARVFGTVRDFRRNGDLPEVELVHTDLTDDASVREGVKSVFEKAGKIDILINNADYGLTGALEETSVEEAQQQFDTNFFGALCDPGCPPGDAASAQRLHREHQLGARFSSRDVHGHLRHEQVRARRLHQNSGPRSQDLWHPRDPGRTGL